MLMRSLLESSTLLKEAEHLCLDNYLPETTLHLKSQSSRPRQSCKSNASTPLPPISPSLPRVKIIEDLTEEKLLKMRVSFTISHTPKIDHALHCSSVIEILMSYSSVSQSEIPSQGMINYHVFHRISQSCLPAKGRPFAIANTMIMTTSDNTNKCIEICWQRDYSTGQKYNNSGCLKCFKDIIEFQEPQPVLLL
nr:hypothetical protein CFP56_26462 [Quercus suber]